MNVHARVSVFIMLLLLPLMSQAALPTMTGSLEAQLKTITYSTNGAANWIRPSVSLQRSFSAVVTQIANGNYAAANTSANMIGFEVIEFTDTDFSPGRIHYILRRQIAADAPTNTYYPDGVYVFHPAGINLTIQSPHPRDDFRTDNEGIEMYVQRNAYALLLSGTRRRNTGINSNCVLSGPIFQESDASHNVDHLFYEAHKALQSADVNTLFIELHGFNAANLTTLQTSCDPTTNNLLVNSSEGIDDSGNFTINTFQHRLHNIIKGSQYLTSCIYAAALDASINDVYSSILGGTKNVSGRLTNGVIDVNICSTAVNPTSSSNRFIHLEQSPDIRIANAGTNRFVMSNYLRLALQQHFGTASSANLSAGDIAIIGMHGDPIDGFSWVPLVDIPAGEVIYFTDSGYYKTGNVIMSTQASTLESLIKFVAPADIAAGTVQTVDDTAETIAPYSIVTGTKFGSGIDMDISIAGDQILAFQSTDPEGVSFANYSFTPLFLISSRDTLFAVTGGADVNATSLFPGLTNAKTAVAKGATMTTDFNNIRYTGATTSGTRTVLLAAIANAANWTGSNIAFPTGYTSNGVALFTVTDSAPVLKAITPVITPASNTMPSYRFSSTQAGTISYAGNCSSATIAAIAGINSITFNALSVGTYSNCTITVTNSNAQASIALAVAKFTINAAVIPPTVAPVPATAGGGGCTVNPQDRNSDPILLLILITAIMLRRRNRGRCQLA